MKLEKQWHKYALAASVIATALIWAIALYFWSKLPAVIPTHFNFAGQPDAWNNKSFFLAFLMPIMQTVFLVGFSFLYFKPQYSDMPTTLLLMALDEKKRNHAFSLIRTMIVVMLLFLSVLFGYLTYAINYASLHNGGGLNIWIMFGIIGAMVAWLVWYTVKVYRVTIKLLKQ